MWWGHSWLTHGIMTSLQGPVDTGHLFVPSVSQKNMLEGVHNHNNVNVGFYIYM